MKGARAEDSVNTTNRDKSNRKIRIGPSHHFFEVFKKKNNSEKIRKRRNIAANVGSLVRLWRAWNPTYKPTIKATTLLVRGSFNNESLLHLLGYLTLVY